MDNQSMSPATFEYRKTNKQIESFTIKISSKSIFFVLLAQTLVSISKWLSVERTFFVWSLHESLFSEAKRIRRYLGQSAILRCWENFFDSWTHEVSALISLSSPQTRKENRKFSEITNWEFIDFIGHTFLDENLLKKILTRI